MHPATSPRRAGPGFAIVLPLTILLAACSGAASPVSSPPVLAPAASVAARATPTSTATDPAPTTPAPVSPSPVPDDGAAWIVYQSPDGLRIIRPDGSDSGKALPEGPSGALHPDWSPDGRRLAFVVDDADGTRDVWTADWDGSNAARLVDCQAPCRDADSPAWSPDGTQIAFNRIDTVDGRNPGSELQTVDVATGAITTAAATTGAEYAGAARWSPDGRSIVVEITRFIDDLNDTEAITGRAIAVVDLDDLMPAFRIVRPFRTYSTYPDWHPTEDLILFAAGARDPLDPSDAPSNLFTIRPDGTGLTQLTNQGPDDDGVWMPAFRPDGSGIVATLVHRPEGNLTLASLGIDGSGITEIGERDVIPGAHSRQRPVPPAP